jgi:hypothetical protein
MPLFHSLSAIYIVEKCTHWSRHHGSYPLLFCMADQGQLFRHYWTIVIVDIFTPGSRQQESSSLLLCPAVNQETIQDIYFFEFCATVCNKKNLSIYPCMVDNKRNIHHQIL